VVIFLLPSSLRIGTKSFSLPTTLNDGMKVGCMYLLQLLCALEICARCHADFSAQRAALVHRSRRFQRKTRKYRAAVRRYLKRTSLHHHTLHFLLASEALTVSSRLSTVRISRTKKVIKMYPQLPVKILIGVNTTVMLSWWLAIVFNGSKGNDWMQKHFASSIKYNLKRRPYTVITSTFSHCS